MGYYIEVPKNKRKAQQLVYLYGAEILPTAPEFWMKDPRQAIICVVDNGVFEAAGFAYDEAELNAFKRPDGRPRTWLLMDRKKVCELTGFVEEEHRRTLGEYR